jgi:hypothetical protein
MESRMRGNVQVRFKAERPEDSSTTSDLSLHLRSFVVGGIVALHKFAELAEHLIADTDTTANSRLLQGR